MARRTVSMEGSLIRDGNASRRTSSSSISNPNIFSDDYALDSTESVGNLSPVDSINDSEQLAPGFAENNYQGLSRSIPLSSLPDHVFRMERPSSSATKRSMPGGSTLPPHRAVSSATQSDASTQRTLSTSSRFSMLRPQSPYNGPTAPSQPYAMYPQVTRASSIASESTIRPSERPFVPQGGPEHPYAMYTQNTVPEEEDDDDDDEAGPDVPGFSGMGQSYRGGSSSSGNDMGDIVGSDGHIEQLPPYTRYADNVLAKGDMDSIDPPATGIIDEPTALSESGPGISDSAIELNSAGSRENGDQMARKEGWVARSKRRRCLGLPLWTVLLIGGIIFVAAALGGVIGGVVGNNRGADHALDATPTTTTIWLDADPVTTGPTTPSCPTGHFTVPLNQTNEVHTCIVDGTYNVTWGCMDIAAIGVNVFDVGPGSPLQVVFDDYSLRPNLFRYGPQPPDFNGTTFELSPYKDREDNQLGVAMFFSVLFDKLIILPHDVLTTPGSTKRSVPASSLFERAEPWETEYLAIGDQPWYCFWNSTISEFYIFIEQNMDIIGASDNTNSSTITSAPSTTSSTSATPSSPSTSPFGTVTTSSQTSSITSSSSGQVYPTWTGSKYKRDFPDTSGSPEFPKLIKMVEKRKPSSNSQPYCQKMQVLNNWQIMPIPNIPTVLVQESEFAQSTGNKRSLRVSPRDTMIQLQSNCICEWFSE